jgi:transcriptional regulator with XRE-family HTH domain
VSRKINPPTAIELEVRAALGNHIRQLRLKRKLSQEELAHLAGIHRNHIGLIELGSVDVRLSTLVRLAPALKVSLSALLEIKVDLES